ncbi:hypothetical protein GCG54_00002905 [Colletotrichum gloeosporioides]|uniref:Esterase n=1 Tax=Colletotrichum gloeosporioides TaxID=474922 RepID=A0A8H4CKB2_COLGL|nr:uncharacterized protein GCG54_00002905 [Colletotrichum gloeosporioides]KAF3805558.1 hypothetical protein GCG54_00002905 [Colletotrichum gloeosporioides]
MPKTQNRVICSSYLVDGNSVLMNALELLHLMCPQGTKDLIPLAEGTFASEGGADAFLDLIQDKTRGATIGKKALFGHSPGGLFVLHARFTTPNSFDCFLASSPSFWWKNHFILKEEVGFRETERYVVTVDRGKAGTGSLEKAR